MHFSSVYFSFSEISDQLLEEQTVHELRQRIRELELERQALELQRQAMESEKQEMQLKIEALESEYQRLLAEKRELQERKLQRKNDELMEIVWTLSQYPLRIWNWLYQRLTRSRLSHSNHVK